MKYIALLILMIGIPCFVYLLYLAIGWAIENFSVTTWFVCAILWCVLWAMSAIKAGEEM